MTKTRTLPGGTMAVLTEENDGEEVKIEDEENVVFEDKYIFVADDEYEPEGVYVEEEIGGPTFKVICKTIEFRSRLNLPPKATDVIGGSQRFIKLIDDETEFVFDVMYKFHKIDKTKKGFGRLTMGWASFVDELILHQGDILYFTEDEKERDLFHVRVERHDKAIQVDNDYWV